MSTRHPSPPRPALSPLPSSKTLTAALASLSDRIREALRSSKDLREDAQFIGLWHSMPDGRREGDYPIEEPQYDDEDDEDVPTPPRSTRRGLSSSASTSALSLRALPPGTPGRLTRSTSQHVSLYSKKSVSDLKEAAEKVKEETVKVVVEAQEKLSNAWSLTAGLVTIEAAYLAYSAVPFQDKVRQGLSRHSQTQ